MQLENSVVDYTNENTGMVNKPSLFRKEHYEKGHEIH